MSIKNKGKYCSHGIYQYYCVECKGAGICKHNKRKALCKECGKPEELSEGENKCYRCNSIKEMEKFGMKNGKPYKTCIDCRTKQKSYASANKCEHGRRKQECIECKGSSICEHGRRKQQCIECKGSSICEHNKQRSSCIECKGTNICEHNKQSSSCIICKPKYFCVHGRKKQQCIECKGSSICEHNKQRSSCIECKGSRICEHNKQRSQCIICHPENACNTCQSVLVKKKSRFYPNCFYCFCLLNPDVEVPRRYKLKEHHLADVLREQFPDTKMVFDKIIDNGCSLRRPDVRIECLTHSIIIECDENQHQGYSCENKRIMEIFKDLGNRPLVIIRFNPDKYDSNPGCFLTNKSGYLSLNHAEWNKRLKNLVSVIQKWLSFVPEKELTQEYLYYDTRE